MKFAVPQEMTVLQALRELSPESSQNTLRSWIQKGRVAIGGKIALRANALIVQGQEIVVKPKSHFIEQDVKVLFKDEHLIVVEKPEGMLSVATDFQIRGTLHDILKRRFHAQRIFPVHRLDRETSGVMVFAYTNAARVGLKKQFAEHTIERMYAAVIEGALAEKTGIWKSRLTEDDLYFVKSTNAESGRIAITHYQVLERLSTKIAVLGLSPVSGRTHQLRVHLEHIGTPILGDPKYGGDQQDFSDYQTLHLHSCITIVPRLGQKPLVLQAEFPPHFQKTCKDFGFSLPALMQELKQFIEIQTSR